MRWKCNAALGGEGQAYGGSLQTDEENIRKKVNIIARRGSGTHINVWIV